MPSTTGKPTGALEIPGEDNAAVTITPGAEESCVITYTGSTNTATIDGVSTTTFDNFGTGVATYKIYNSKAQRYTISFRGSTEKDDAQLGLELNYGEDKQQYNAIAITKGSWTNFSNSYSITTTEELPVGNIVFYMAFNQVNVANLTFTPITAATYTISASADDAEAGTVSGAGEYVENTSVTLTATPKYGYKFVNWTENESVVITENPYTFTISADKTLVANFEKVDMTQNIPGDIDLSKGKMTASSNSAKITGDGQTDYVGNGDDILLPVKSEKDGCYTISFQTSTIKSNATMTFSLLDSSNKEVWTETTDALAQDADWGTFHDNTVQTSFVSAGSYKLKMAWHESINVKNVKVENTSYDITLTQPAENAQGSFKVKVGDGEETDANTTAIYGQTITLVPTAGTGYQLKSLKYNDTDIEKDGEGNYKFTMPEKDVTITAEFVKIKYALTAASAEHGTIVFKNVDSDDNPIGDAIASGTDIEWGTKIYVEATPANGYELDALTVKAGEDNVEVNENKFTMPAANVTVTAEFKAIKYTVTFDSDGGSGVDAEQVAYGTKVSEPSTPPTKTDNIFLGWYNGDDKFDFETAITANITLTAKWTSNKVEKAADDNGNNNATEDYTLQDAEHATLTGLDVNSAEELRIPATVNGVPVTSIAADVFTAEKTADLNLIDLSSTKVELTGDVRSSGVLKDVPENVIIVLPQESSTATGKNVVTTTDGTNFTCSEVVISESKSFINNAKDFTTKKFSFDRTFLTGSGQMNTIFLPIDIPQEVANTLGTFYTCNSVNESGAVLTQVTSGGLSANTAYIFATTSNKLTYDGSTELTVKINKGVNNPTGAGLKGTNKEGTISELATDPTKAYGYAAEAKDDATVGQFVKLKGTATVPAYRAWLEVDNASYAHTLSIIIDGETTGIVSIDGVPVGSQDETPRYNLKGQRVSKSQKGLIIMNGKKVLVK